MAEKTNSTKRMATSEKSKNPARPAASTPAKSSVRVDDTDMESGDESTGEEQEEDEEEERETTYKYQPPENFAPLSSDGVRDSNPFSAANLKGKELWFITAPVNAPLSKLSVIEAQDIVDGAPIMETKSGRGYCLKTDDESLDDSARATIMVPDSKGVYRAAGKPISKAFRLVETLPKPPKITKDRVPTAKPVRLQPPGLKMRYRPFGAKEIEGAVDGMDIDEDHVEEGSPERKKKRQKGTEDGEKKKKKKKNKEKNLA